MNSWKSWWLAGRVAGALLLGLLAAGVARADPQVYRKLLHSTGWVVVPTEKGVSAGT